MDLTQLRTFVAVVEEGHLTRAADRLHISQPAASGHIRMLERDLDVVLFERRSRGLELTKAGQVLLHRARRVLAEARSFTSTAREFSGRIQGALVLGCNNDPILSRAADVVGHMHCAHPAIGLSVRVQSSGASLQSTRSGETDAAFLLAQSVDDSLAALTLRPVSFCVAGPAKWQSLLQEADWQRLADLPWVTATQGNSYHRMLQVLFGEKGLQVNSVTQTDNDAMTQALILAGVGVSLVREDIAIEAQAAGLMAIWPNAVTTTQLMFVHARHRSDDPLIAALVGAVKTVWAAGAPAVGAAGPVL
ncbi:LysR family transcriptional regulator [Verticiella sediminum]|nr:LysR family transcriptional regulator [Verticiella sediminum]